jgi:hypothetical protein
MGLALETIVGYVASGTGSTTYDALSNNTNQSFTVRSFQEGSHAWLEDVWAATSAAQWLLSIKSPRLHDDVKGLLYAVNAYTNTGSTVIFNPNWLTPSYQQQALYSTDVLSVTANAATGTNKLVGVFNVRYENLGGVNARLHSWNEIAPLVVNYVGIEVQPQASGTVGVFGSGVAVNSVDQRLKANTDYAWLGWQTSIPVTAIVMQGVDLGNLYVGGPGYYDNAETGSFFIDKSMQYGVSHIPVINSNNQGGTFVSVADITASTHPNVTLQFAELRTRLGGQ